MRSNNFVTRSRGLISDERMRDNFMCKTRVLFRLFYIRIFSLKHFLFPLLGYSNFLFFFLFFHIYFILLFLLFHLSIVLCVILLINISFWTFFIAWFFLFITREDYFLLFMLAFVFFLWFMFFSVLVITNFVLDMGFVWFWIHLIHIY